jgi:hypothetical protein
MEDDKNYSNNNNSNNSSNMISRPKNISNKKKIEHVLSLALV